MTTNEPSPSQPMNEGEYLEMANHLKITYDSISAKLFKCDIKIMELKKELMTAYGFIRVIDNIADNIYDIPTELVVLIDCLRSHLSESIDKQIFNIVGIEELI
tara:strand:+ start:2523 stop:2831 length:309 start_codon:yes stop_codon:yes gene_type:complete